MGLFLNFSRTPFVFVFSKSGKQRGNLSFVCSNYSLETLLLKDDIYKPSLIHMFLFKTALLFFLLAFSIVSNPLAFVSCTVVQDGLGVPLLHCVINSVQRELAASVTMNSAVGLYLVS